ncbi:hypothetical protein CHUAL_002350 [Chamberlinius hualienensis]
MAILTWFVWLFYWMTSLLSMVIFVECSDGSLTSSAIGGASFAAAAIASSSADGWITSVTGEFDFNTSAVVGGSVQLPCNITSPTEDDRTHLVLWYKQESGNPIYTLDLRDNKSQLPAVLPSDDIRRRVTFFPKVGSPYLLVKDVRAEDQGLYRCRVDFRKARSRNSLVHLNVIVPPKVPSILGKKGLDLESRIGPYNEGSSLFLSCEVVGGHPPPQVTWWRDGKLLDDSYEVTSLAIVRNDLMVQSLTRNDFQAVYTCKATNNNMTQPVSSSVTVDMNLKPLDVVISDKQQELMANKQYRLICRSSGSRPPPVFAWWKDEKRLKTPQESMSEDKNVTTSILNFTPTSADHEKTISCRAENPVIPGSNIQDSWQLSVYYAPIVNLKPGESVNLNNIREGDDVYLECNIKAHPSSLRVDWKFQGKPLLNNVTSGVITSNQSLVLQKMRRNHSGLYSCAATNAEGEGESKEIRLQVKHVPVCSPNLKTVYRVARDETVRIPCEVESFPRNVKFSWKTNRSAEHGDDLHYQLPSEEMTSIMSFTPKTAKDFGKFYCWAENEVGQQKMPCIFTVEPAGPPDPVNNCTVINQTQTVISVSCKSGYDGGLPQTFICDVIDAANKENKRSLTSGIPSCLIDDLHPGVNYIISIYASNHKGRSQELSLTTETLKYNSPDHSVSDKFTTILGVIIGIVIALVFIAVTILLVMKVKTSGHSNMKHAQPAEHSDRCSVPLRKDVDDCLENEEKSPDIICNTNEQEFPNVKVRCLEKWAYGSESPCENCLRHQRLSTFTGGHHIHGCGENVNTSAGCSYPMRKIQPVSHIPTTTAGPFNQTFHIGSNIMDSHR